MFKNNAWTLSLVFVAMVLASVGLKYLFLKADVAVDSVAVASDLVDLSRARGMVAQRQQVFGGAAMIATGGRCAMAVRVVSPSGELDRAIASDFASYPRTRYFYAGELTDKRPRMGPLLTYQWARAVNRLGIAQRWRPLLAVADNGLCAASLTEFSSIRAPMRQEVAGRQRP